MNYHFVCIYNNFLQRSPMGPHHTPVIRPLFVGPMLSILHRFQYLKAKTDYGTDWSLEYLQFES